MSGRSAVWLARHVRDVEVLGSNPSAPTIIIHTNLKMPAKSKIQRVHVIYTGSVQGVGFRFTAEGIASSLGLTGFVKNLPDGGVELLAEGEKELLAGLIDGIKSKLRGYIRDADVRWLPATGEFSSFEIRFF